MSESIATPAAQALQLHDGRPFFEKALVFGIRHGLIDDAKLAAIHADAPKGMVQIARYFGTEFLRPDLEKARERMVNLISLYLLETTEANLEQAAISLRDHSLLSRSKGGSDMLKRLIAMPESSNFGMVGYADAQTPLLAVWSLRSHADYRLELARRTEVAHLMEAAQWFASQFDLDEDSLQESGADAEAVIRAGLLWLALAPSATEWPHVLAFQKALSNARHKKKPLVIHVPSELTEPCQAAVAALCQAVQTDVRRLWDPATDLHHFLRPMGSFRARYFLLDDPLSEVDDFYRCMPAQSQDDTPAQAATKTWIKAMQGHEDEPSLLTLFVCLAAGVSKKTLLTEKAAASLVRKIRKSGWQPSLAKDFISQHAPGPFQADYGALWDSFVQEAAETLMSDKDYHLHDAMALLRRECHISASV
jgi:hypothetical protein